MAVGTAAAGRHTEAAAAAGYKELPVAVVRTGDPAGGILLVAGHHTGAGCNPHAAAAEAVRTALAVHIVLEVLQPGEEHTEAAGRSVARCTRGCYRRKAVGRAGSGRMGHVVQGRRRKGYCCRSAIDATGAMV